MVEATQAPANKSGHEVLTGATYWFTGLSGAGKSTLSEYCKAFLDKDTGSSKNVFILDGDVIRTGLNKDLGFGPEARNENIRRITEVAKLFNMAGMIVFVAFISPYAEARDNAKAAHAAAGLKFFEAYISANLECCEGRDVKGLYKKARDGTIPNFTGVTAPYEAPQNPDLNINTGDLPIEGCKNMVIRQMEEAGVLRNLAEPRVVDSLVVECTEEQSAAHAAFPKLHINKEQAEYLQTIGEGFAFPLKRFMNEMELLEVMQMQTVTDNNGHAHLLSVPITQFLSTEEKDAMKDAPAVALVCDEVMGGEVLAVIHKPTFFANRKEEICTRTFGCFSKMHPKIENIMTQGDWLISGESMHFCKHVMFNDGIDKYRMNPRQIQAAIKAKGADAVYAFQVRNPLHNGHVLLLNDTREQLIKQGYKNPVLLLHPLGGWCKDDDVPLDTRMAQHQALLDDGTLNPEHTILAVWPSPMYYGGPTEVLWHASSRVGCGITHFITGRDPAGVAHPDGGDCYDVWHGQKILMHLKHMLNGVEVVPFKVAAYNKPEEKMTFFQPGVSKGADFDFISGSRMRAMAKEGTTPPSGFMSPGGWEVLAAYYKAL